MICKPAVFVYNITALAAPKCMRKKAQLEFLPTKLLFRQIALISVTERKGARKIGQIILGSMLKAALTEARLLACEPATTDSTGPYRGERQNYWLGVKELEFLREYALALRVDPMLLAKKLMWLGIELHKRFGFPRLRSKEDFSMQVRSFFAAYFFEHSRRKRRRDIRLAS